ncbi:hypothetical protein ACVW0P_002538 [Mucilaginibacter sp. UYNi724]
MAAIMLAWLEILFLYAVKLYYNEYSNQFDYSPFISIQVLIPFAIIVLTKYFAFINNKKWKIYFKEFDGFPEGKKDKGTIIFIGIV